MYKNDNKNQWEKSEHEKKKGRAIEGEFAKNPDAKKPEDLKKALKEKRRARRKANAEAEEQAKKAWGKRF